MGINIAVFRKEIDKAVDRSIYPTAKRRIEKQIEEYKQEAIKKFEDSPITQELSEASMGNSDTRSQFLTNGNLYGLMGFNQDDGDPTEPIKNALEEGINIMSINKRNTNDKMVYRVEARVGVITVDELESISVQYNHLGWTGRSWLDMVKRGVGGFQRTIFKDYSENANSRSKMALQSKNGNVRGETFNGVKIPYVNEFLAELKAKIRGQQ